MALFKIETSMTVTLRRYWHIQANSEDEARDAFEDDSDNATFLSEEVADVMDGDSVVEVTPMR